MDLGEVNDEHDLPWIEVLDGESRGTEIVAHGGLCMTARRGADDIQPTDEKPDRKEDCGDARGVAS